MLAVKFLFSCVVIFGVANCATLYNENLIVETKAGRVQGLQGLTREQSRPYYSFRGIPFAEPPVGALRFEAPVPKSSWSGVLDGTKDGARCIQGSDPVDGSEDCLFINVYTPALPSASNNLLPTFVWIYGGGFEGGDSSYELYGPDHILDQDVVVVTLNYRLGLLGFLSTGDTVAPGNNGIKDQLLALQWVQDNIANFGGDPNAVTLGGQSAGAVAVGFLLQSKRTQGLIHRAILSSGTSLNMWGLALRVPQIVTQVANNLGINNSSSRAIVDGLKSLDVVTLQTEAASTITSAYLSNNPREGFGIGPVIEPDHPDALITGLSHQKLVDGDFNKVPILLGFNSLEGTYNFDVLFRLFLVQYDLDPVKLLPNFNVASNEASAAARKLKSHYFGWIPISLSNMELMKFLSEDQFIRPIREFARLTQKHVPTYLYRFSYEGGLWGIHNRTTPGVTHSEELGYYWVSNHNPLREHDLVVKSRVTALWTNFIKEANPTPRSDARLASTTWSTVDNDLNYLDIGHDLVVTQLPERTNMKFFDDLFAEYGHPPYNTY